MAGGRGIQVDSGVGSSFRMCFPWGGGGFASFVHIRNERVFLDMEGQGEWLERV